MSFYEFKKSDILLNKLKTHPKSEFFIYDGTVYRNNLKNNTLSLYDNLSGSYPFAYKDKHRYFLKSYTTSSFDVLVPGDIMTGVYPQTASISVDIYDDSYKLSKPQLYYNLFALKNTFNSYLNLSRHYEFNSSLYGSKDDTDASIISIPSVFYGSQIQPRTVKCKFYISGTLAAELNDERGNGEMIQVGPAGSNGSGSIAGVVLYKEGFMYLSGAWDIDAGHTESYGLGSDRPKWKYFGEAKNGIPSSSYGIEFKGTNSIPVMTMHAHANAGELNNSNNPTFVVTGSETIKTTGSHEYIENPELPIKNVTATPFNSSGSFEKTTYISTIGIYDEEKNLIATAKLAKPLRKRERDSYTFKLKLDL